MLKTIEVVFDGKAFVPTGPVDVPEGTRCVVQIPSLQPPPPVSAEHEKLWAEITRQIEASAPVHATADDAMETLRGRL